MKYLILICIISSIFCIPGNAESYFPENIMFTDNVKNQEFNISSFNSSYLVLILFDITNEYWILDNGSIFYDCFDNNDITLITLFVDRDQLFSTFSLMEKYWDNKVELYDKPSWYFGYLNDRSQITDISNQFMTYPEGGGLNFRFLLLESSTLEILYSSYENDILAFWNIITEYVSPTTTPQTLKQLLKNPKKATGFLLVPILLSSILLAFLRKRKNEI